MKIVHAALLCALALPISGCATTKLDGEYRTHTSAPIVNKGDKKQLAKGGEWLFLWGLLDSGRFDVQDELRKDMRENEVITDLTIKDRLSVGGFFLWLFTGGIVSHHAIIAEGARSTIATPPPVKERERETIIIPPAGPGGHEGGTYERERPVDKGTAPEYREGYREGVKDATKDSPPPK